MKAGMNVARFNLSHGTYGEHTQAIRTLKKLTKATATPVGVLLDLPGPKYRTGKLKGGQAVLKRGAQLTITTRQIKGDAGLVSVNLTYTCARYQGGRYGIA